MVLADKEKVAEQRPVKTILVVEDDAGIGEIFVQAIMQETAYMAVLVADGFQALRTAQKIKPDLLILDYHLPHMNGIELYDRLHENAELSCIPALMISATLPEQELARRNLRSMRKPIDLDDFLQAIEDLI